MLTLLAGITIPLGGLLARVDQLNPRWLTTEWRHGIMAFGGGILLAAVALVLVPEGAKDTPLAIIVVAMLAGGLAFMWLDRYLARHSGSASQLTAMLSDFLSESVALGAMLCQDGGSGLLLAAFIALQNLPEGFNAYREIQDAGRISALRLLSLFAAMSLLGPAAGLLGFYALAPFPLGVDVIMLFGAGGILYLTFEDIAPSAKLERDWLPPLGAVAGFLLGVVGQQILG